LQNATGNTDALNLSQSTVSDKTNKIKQILEEISKNPISEFAIEYPSFALKQKKLSDFVPQIYNIWNFSRNNNETRHFGNVLSKTQKEISIKLHKIDDIFNELYQNPKSENGIKYPSFAEKIEKLYQFQPFIYNIWNVSKNNNETKHYNTSH